MTRLKEKISESLSSVLPITAIVFLLCVTIAPVTNNILMMFLVGAAMVIIGMGFFTIGVELSMTPIGENVGSTITKSKKIWLVAFISFIIGIIVTVSEPDLQVLAQQVPTVPNMVLILSVAVGVGIFLVVAMMRSIFGIALKYLLTALYALVFILAFFAPPDFLAVAFDAGGVTTGPMTVPFIMALGVGVAAIRRDRHAADDSFGLVALSSVGPIIAVLILGMLYRPDGSYSTSTDISAVNNTRDLGQIFAVNMPQYMGEVAVSLLPIAVFFALFQLSARSFSKKRVIKIAIGFIYTYIGLVLFLTGANVGFMPAGSLIGQQIASLPYNWVLVPIGMVIGYFIVAAEPAVYVLNKQVAQLTVGEISERAMGISLSVGVAISLGLSMIRVLTGLPILYFLLPGYCLAILLTFVTPKIFTAIAFDSGGVASGTMTSTFLLSFAMGACGAVGGNITTDAFGLVALVAMTPLITIQILGVVYKIKQNKAQKLAAAEVQFDDEIIEL